MSARIDARLAAFGFATLLLFAIGISPAANGATATRQYSVGVAKVDVTPSYPVRLNGFGFRRDESEGVNQRIWAKALAIGTDAERPLVLIAIDNCGIPLSMVNDVAARLKDNAPIDRDRVAVTFTHTHTAPKVNGVCDTIFSSPTPPDHQERIDRYTRELADAMEQAALAALANRRPAELHWSIGKVGFAKNRRPQGGPVDHDLRMLVVKSPDGALRAVYVSYACHCVTLSHNKIGGDWAGYAQEAIERNHPGAIALVSIGCGSDANPDSGVTGDNTAAAAGQGDQIAVEVDRLLKTELQPIGGDTTAQFRTIQLPLAAPPSRQELEALAKEASPAGYNASVQVARLDRGEPLLAALNYPIQTWSFGDSLAIAFLGGEICADYSVRLKKELDASRVWLNGYSNDFSGYIPSERLLREGGYGGGEERYYMAWPAPLAPGMEAKVLDEVRRQIPQPFHDPTRGAQRSGLPHMHVEEGFVVELAAAEPLVADPVAIDFGPDGRLWVAEMPDYTREADAEFVPTGCVKALVDRDSDGTFDEAAVFQGGLRFPTDVKAWDKGVIVCDAPDVIYLEDSDGDGRADIRKTLLTGFATHNPQARVNSLRWGLDNWLYGAGGIYGGDIKSFSGQEAKLGSRDFRFRPATGEIEAVTGSTQQGRARDDWGNWFGCANSNLLKHYPLADHYLSRNPHIAPAAVETFPPYGPRHDHLFPIGEPTLYKLSGPPGRPTSVCGLEVYRDELLGPEFAGNAFVAEPVNRLVHRMALAPHGATFRALRPTSESDREFLASTEPWFRPVQIRTGLDGCLWIVDMHRAVIEHPKFIPAETLSTLDPMAGSTQGRIYRIRPLGQPARPAIRFDKLNVAELVAALDSPNGPQRDLAQQLLIERGARDAAPALTRLAKSSKRPATRLQALCAIDGLGMLEKDQVLRALSDPHAGMRSHAVRLAEQFLNQDAEIARAVLRLADDDDPQVKLQTAYTLGAWNDAQAAAGLVNLARTSHADPHLLSAVWSSIHRGNVSSVLDGLLSGPADKALPDSFIEPVVRLATNLGDDACVARVLTRLRGANNDASAAAAWRLDVLAGLFAALPPERRQAIANANADFRSQLDAAAAQARQLLESQKADQRRTLAAVRILAAASPEAEDLVDFITPLLGPQQSPAIQQAAIRLLAAADAQQATDALLDGWHGYSPAVRSMALDAFMERPKLLSALMQKLAAGEIKPTDIDAVHRQRLLTLEDAHLREQAAAAFAGAIDADRQKVVAQYAAVVNAPANPTHGREVFTKHCASCHKLDGQGFTVGPDLAALTSRGPVALLEAVFDPNRTVDERFQNYLAATDEGLTHTGILVRETSSSITLLEQEGKERTLLRKNLEALRNTGLSLMPVGFEKDLTPADFADLLAYLAEQSTPSKKLPGNAPKLVEADADGAVWLQASNSAVYGDQITFELPYQNIGYWYGQADHVAWDLVLDKANSFQVHLHWACDDLSAGNAAVVEGFDKPLRVVVDSTGGYDHYQTRLIANVRLPAGKHRIVVRPDGPLTRPNLMDLRGIYLVPQGVSPDRAVAGRPPEEAPDAANAIAKLLDGLAVGTPAEYERIPAIWEHAITAGKRNVPDELRRVLRLSLPESGQPLQHWQAVVIGGGLVNGLSQIDVWPRRRVLELIDGDQDLTARWEYLIDRAAAMADDTSVRPGTRYDALRILGADRFERSGATLVRYAADEHAELQMGAVSGLSDVEHDQATEALIAGFAKFTESNRSLAFKALTRTKERGSALVEAVESGRIPKTLITAEQFDNLQQLLQ